MKKKKNNKYDSYEEDIIHLDDDDEVIESYAFDDDDEIEEVYEIDEEELETKSSNKVSTTTEYKTDYTAKYKNDYNTEYTNQEKIETTDDYIDEEYESFDEEELEYLENRQKKIKKIINIAFTVIMLILIFIATDVICVARYNVGPFFAIPLHKYKDGGSKAYYGVGYKVIKYNQTQGRRDREIGFWTLRYNSKPITIQDIDLAIEFNNNEIEAYEKYYKKFVRIISTLKRIDNSKKQIILGYKDEDKKYSLEIVCTMAKDQKITDLKTNKEITIIGSVNDFKIKTTQKENRLFISNCFAEQ